MTFTNKKATAVQYDPRKHALRFEGQDLLQSLCHRGDRRVVARVKGSKDLVEWVELETLPTVSNQEVLARAQAVLQGDSEPLPIETPEATPTPTDWSFTRSEVERAKRRALRRIGRKVRKACRKKGRLVVKK